MTLTAEEREALGHTISRGKADARKLAHARVLLQADASDGGPDWTDTRIAEAVRVSVRTIERVRQRFVEEGLEAALLPRPSPRVYARKPDRVGDRATLQHHVQAWQHRRNAAATRADWQFTTKDARIKLRKLYPTMNE